ncbi:hypothetical protein [Enteractinococcus coprophilus]|uniref:Uncharacterized protein n=1 Tax=Enteractinococcus coprophilus TaxID=1027633 RepID=A0A543AFL2_9MICC|nr:hypothetical protein [Enteractinococcus coprophilus]TQL71316.1 hypothetical protein FB556_1789 [Enteractinococcus coprophilus]
MTNHPNSDSEDPRPRDEGSSSESVTPPPPPEKPQDDGVGLATEMVFSGHQREQLRNAPDYETFETGVLSFDDEELYQDVQQPVQAEAQTELNITSEHSDARDAARSAHFQSASARFEPGQSGQDEFGNYQARSFDPKQQYSKQPGTTNEPFALVMFVILTLAGLGILGTLLWLVYRLITGA